MTLATLFLFVQILIGALVLYVSVNNVDIANLDCSILKPDFIDSSSFSNPRSQLIDLEKHLKKKSMVDYFQSIHICMRLSSKLLIPSQSYKERQR